VVERREQLRRLLARPGLAAQKQAVDFALALRPDHALRDLTAVLSREHRRFRGRRRFAGQVGVLLASVFAAAVVTFPWSERAVLTVAFVVVALIPVLVSCWAVLSQPSRRWRNAVVALTARVARLRDPALCGFLVEAYAVLEEAPRWVGHAPRHTLLNALTALLPRMDVAEASALTPPQRELLRDLLGRSDVGTDLHVAALLVLGTARDYDAAAAALRLSSGHPNERIRVAANETLRELGVRR
jgi:hypothetical protein